MVHREGALVAGGKAPAAKRYSRGSQTYPSPEAKGQLVEPAHRDLPDASSIRRALLVPQGHHGINLRGPARGHIRSEQCHRQKECRDKDKGDRVMRTDAVEQT